MIAEAAYYLAQKRGFSGEHTLDDWLAAEQQVRHVISPIDFEATMDDATGLNPDQTSKPRRESAPTAYNPDLQRAFDP